jgi:acetyl-CoA synthetase
MGRATPAHSWDERVGPTAGERFRAARDVLLEHRTDYEAACRAFQWPDLPEFNWSLDWFDAVAARTNGDALWIVEDDGSDARWTYRELSDRSSQVANWLRHLGVSRGDRVLVMLSNQVELWETALAAMKLGAVIVPATTLLGERDLEDRLSRGRIRFVVARSAHANKFDGLPGDYVRISVDNPPSGWQAYSEAYGAGTHFDPHGPTRSDDPLLLYFTSGTTAKPKLVEHTHASYPVGHLSTMYWIGLRPGDVHLNVASPGWAKHAWSSFFAPWSAEATILVCNYERFDAKAFLQQVERCTATTLCAPPTVWRLVIQEDLAATKVSLREAVAAGEPLNPEVIDTVRRAWGLTIRDGYGQTETTAQIGNPPGAPIKEGSMGRPLPGCSVALLDTGSGAECDEGEIALPLDAHPLGLMEGYRDSAEVNADAMRHGYYHTGDIAARDADGYITFIGRSDDVFKTSGYRISPFELESVLLEHASIAEAAVVPSPDPIRLVVPKAYITLAPGIEPTASTAATIFDHCRVRLAPYERVRRLEITDLPKTISGKIRRVELRSNERDRHADGPVPRASGEFWEEDFPAPSA